jgi:hypothetical protein
VPQQDNSRAAVERLLAELATTDDPAHADGLANQVRLHAELAGLSPDEVAAMAAKVPPAKPAKAAAKAAEG